MVIVMKGGWDAIDRNGQVNKRGGGSFKSREQDKE